MNHTYAIETMRFVPPPTHSCCQYIYFTDNKECSPEVAEIVMPVAVFLQAVFAHFTRQKNTRNSLIHSNFVRDLAPKDKC